MLLEMAAGLAWGGLAPRASGQRQLAAIARPAAVHAHPPRLRCHPSHSIEHLFSGSCTRAWKSRKGRDRPTPNSTITVTLPADAIVTGVRLGVPKKSFLPEHVDVSLVVPGAEEGSALFIGRVPGADLEADNKAPVLLPLPPVRASKLQLVFCGFDKANSDRQHAAFGLAVELLDAAAPVPPGEGALAALCAACTSGAAAGAPQATQDAALATALGLARASAALPALMAVLRILATRTATLSSALAAAALDLHQTMGVQLGLLAQGDAALPSLGASASSEPFEGKLVAQNNKCRIEDDGASVYSTSSGAVATLDVGIESGKLEWEFKLVEDDPGSQCSCFGIAIMPLTNYAYDSSNQLWMWRSYNGYLYERGSQTRTLEKIAKGDIIRFELDMDAGELRAVQNGVDRGVVFSGLADVGKVYPAVQFYSSGRKVTVMDCVMPGAGGPPSLLTEEAHECAAEWESVPKTLPTGEQDAAAQATLLAACQAAPGCAALAPSLDQSATSWHAVLPLPAAEQPEEGPAPERDLRMCVAALLPRGGEGEPSLHYPHDPDAVWAAWAAKVGGTAADARAAALAQAALSAGSPAWRSAPDGPTLTFEVEFDGAGTAAWRSHAFPLAGYELSAEQLVGSGELGDDVEFERTADGSIQVRWSDATRAAVQAALGMYAARPELACVPIPAGAQKVTLRVAAAGSPTAGVTPAWIVPSVTPRVPDAAPALSRVLWAEQGAGLIPELKAAVVEAAEPTLPSKPQQVLRMLLETCRRGWQHTLATRADALPAGTLGVASADAAKWEASETDQLTSAGFNLMQLCAQEPDQITRALEGPFFLSATGPGIRAVLQALQAMPLPDLADQDGCEAWSAGASALMLACTAQIRAVVASAVPPALAGLAPIASSASQPWAYLPEVSQHASARMKAAVNVPVAELLDNMRGLAAKLREAAAQASAPRSLSAVRAVLASALDVTDDLWALAGVDPDERAKSQFADFPLGSAVLEAQFAWPGSQASASAKPDARQDRLVLLLQATAAQRGWRCAVHALWGASVHVIMEVPTEPVPPETSTPGPNAEGLWCPDMRPLRHLVTGDLKAMFEAAGMQGWSFPAGCRKPEVRVKREYVLRPPSTDAAALVGAGTVRLYSRDVASFDEVHELLQEAAKSVQLPRAPAPAPAAAGVGASAGAEGAAARAGAPGAGATESGAQAAPAGPAAVAAKDGEKSGSTPAVGEPSGAAASEPETTAPWAADEYYASDSEMSWLEDDM